MNQYDFGNFDANTKFLESLNINWKGKKVLEIGCGNGSMTKYLYDLGADITAIDLSETFINTAKSRFGNKIAELFHVMSGDDIKFENNSFDIAVSFDLIEHIPEVPKHINEVARVLKTGGQYYFQTPNKLPSALFAIYRYKHLTKYKINHPSLQTKSSLLRTFNQAGLTLSFPKVDYYTPWYVNKLPMLLRGINPRKLGIETNIYGIGTKS